MQMATIVLSILLDAELRCLAAWLALIIVSVSLYLCYL